MESAVWVRLYQSSRNNCIGLQRSANFGLSSMIQRLCVPLIISAVFNLRNHDWDFLSKMIITHTLKFSSLTNAAARFFNSFLIFWRSRARSNALLRSWTADAISAFLQCLCPWILCDIVPFLSVHKMLSVQCLILHMAFAFRLSTYLLDEIFLPNFGMLELARERVKIWWIFGGRIKGFGTCFQGHQIVGYHLQSTHVQT